MEGPKEKEKEGGRIIHEDFLVALENKLQVYIAHLKQKEFVKRWQEELKKRENRRVE